MKKTTNSKILTISEKNDIKAINDKINKDI